MIFMRYLLRATAVATVLAAATASAAPFSVYYEGAAPGAQYTTATFSATGIETFDTRPTGFSSFTTDFGSHGAFGGTYSNVQINPADQFGGSGGNTNYAVSFSTYSLDLTSASKRGVTFFGYWLSALDAGNLVTFSSRGRELFTFKPADVIAAVNAGANPSQYYGNPNAAFAGQNTREPYIFLSFYSNNRPFDKVVFTENPRQGGYESDNHTVGRFTGTGTGTLIPLISSGTPGAVPEPATWAMIVVGFGLVGAGMRRRTRNTVTA
jgi:hypothetical protein